MKTPFATMIIAVAYATLQHTRFRMWQIATNCPTLLCAPGHTKAGIMLTATLVRSGWGMQREVRFP